MDGSDKDKIDEMLDLVRENNKILRKMNRKMMWGQIMTYIYWLAIIGVAGWTYVYFEPYIKQYKSLFDKATQQLQLLEEKTSAIPTNVGGILNAVQKLGQ